MEWTQAELEDLERKTIKIITMNHALYLPGSIGGCEMLPEHQTDDEEERALEEYLKNREENALKLLMLQKLTE